MAEYREDRKNFRNIGSADDMIRANGEAEEQETQALREAAREYSRQITELKELYQKNNEMIEELQRMNIETTKGIQDAVRSTAARDSSKDFQGMQHQVESSMAKTQEELLDSLTATQQKIADLIQESQQFSHKENVRVYRNIQAATDQLLQDQTKVLSNQMDTIKDIIKKPKKTPLVTATFVLVILLFLYEIADSVGLITLLVNLVIGG